MYKDFQIKLVNGLGEMSFDQIDDIRNNVFFSQRIKKLSFWFNPKFGSRTHLLQQEGMTARVEPLAKEYEKESLQWLLDIERAKKLEVTAQKNGLNRVDIHTQVTQADNHDSSFETFVEVV